MTSIQNNLSEIYILIRKTLYACVAISIKPIIHFLLLVGGLLLGVWLGFLCSIVPQGYLPILKSATRSE